MSVADDDTAAVTTAIAGLRGQLSCRRTLEHPAVRHELRMLDEQLAAQLERDGHEPGRHRCPPTAVSTAPELIAVLGH